MKAKSLSLALLLLAAGSQTTTAQKVIVDLEDDQVIEYDVSQVRSIRFEEGAAVPSVTGIIMQGTENPLFGTFSIPAEIRPNLLLAYYGLPIRKGNFPTTDDANYVWKDEALTMMDWQMIYDVNVFSSRAGKLLINEDENGKAYAGKVYMTINPSTFDATGMEVNLVNSQDEVSPIRLSPLRRSDTVLRSGRLRAADNGFYEANAYIDKYDLEDVSLNIDESMLAQTPSALIDFLSICANFGQNIDYYVGIYGDLDMMASEFYQSIRSCELFSYVKSAVSNLDRIGLKCSIYNSMGEESSVYSQYNLTAASYRPFGLELCKYVYFSEDSDPFSGKDVWGPFMVASNDGRGIKCLSDVSYTPTVMRKYDLKLYLTTKTMELVVPIARKHIAVTNVFNENLGTSAQDGDADCLEKLNAANADDMFNTVFDGTVREVEVNNLASGYIYELAYSVLDFEGNISTRKFYIKVAE